MRVFKIRWFYRWAAREGLSDQALLLAAEEMVQGLIDADLGGHVIKKRIAIPGYGKRGSLRTLVAFGVGNKLFFIYGFAKNARANISRKELAALKKLARELLGYQPAILAKAMQAGELIEVRNDG